MHRYLCEESYWAAGRTRETVERLLHDATRVVGVYDGDATVGSAGSRATARTYAFLFDVFVLPDYRGRGLGVELVREAVELGPHADLPWSWAPATRTSCTGASVRRPGPERQMFRPGAKRP